MSLMYIFGHHVTSSSFLISTMVRYLTLQDFLLCVLSNHLQMKAFLKFEGFMWLKYVTFPHGNAGGDRDHGGPDLHSLT